MILPWLQVEQEAFERAVELAAVLEIGEAQALGHLVWLWRWALSRPADTELSGLVSGPTAIAQIEAGARWKGGRGALVTALAELGLAAEEETSHRVKGLDRYREQLQKRAQDRERKANWKAQSGDAEETRKERGGDRPFQRQMQIQTQSQKEELPLSAVADPRPVKVFEHWRKVMAKNARTAFDDKRRKAVERRLADGYTAEDLCRAIEGCSFTPHNMGENDRKERFDDLELICRDAAHVDRFRATALAAHPPSARPDFDEFQEAIGIVRPIVGRGQLVTQLEQLRWQRTEVGLVGSTEDPFFLSWLTTTYAAQLEPLGIGFEGPPLREGAAA